MMNKTNCFFAVLMLMATGALAMDYDSWAASNGITGAATDDADGDGLDNLSEYAVQEAPTFTQVGDVYNVKHLQRKNDSDLTFSLEVCTDLEAGFWNAVIASPETVSIDGTFDEVTYTIPSESSQFFVRVKVTNVGGTSQIINVLDSVNHFSVTTLIEDGPSEDPYNLDIFPDIKSMFPTVVKVPDWVPADRRADPEANYYLYTAQHKTHYQIQLSWASSLDTMSATTWHDHPVPVIDLAADSSRDWDHVSAADCYVDHDKQIFVFAFHGESSSATVGGKEHGNFMATSPWGLNFNDPSTGGGVQEPRFDGELYGVVEYPGHSDNVDASALVAAQYNRVFKNHGRYYGIGKRGQLYRAPLDDLSTERYEPLCADVADGANAWEEWPRPTEVPERPRPSGEYNDNSRISPFALFAGSTEFAEHPNNPHPGEVCTSAGDSATDTGWVNHFDIVPYEEDGLFEVFFYMKVSGDLFLDHYRVILDARDPDWSQWDLMRSADGEVIFQVVIPDRHDALSGNELGDPCVFRDNGRTFLFFCYGSSREGDISVVELHSIEPWEYLDLTDDAGAMTAQYGDSPDGEQVGQLFDNSATTKFLTFNASCWVQVQFENNDPYVVTKYTLTSANDEPDRDPRNWTLSGSNDGSNWTEVDTQSGRNFTTRGLRREFDCSDNTTAYSYYRLDMENNAGEILQVAEIELLP